MTFDDAVAEAYEQGWYVYSLCWERATEGFPVSRWHCTLRQLEGPPRREISRGYGDTADEAICAALGNVPEIEDPVSVSNLNIIEPTFDLLAAIRKPVTPLKRRV